MKITEKDLCAEVGSYILRVEKFIDQLVAIFFTSVTDRTILADEIVRRIRKADELRDFFKRVAKRVQTKRDYEKFSEHMKIASELFKFRNDLAHGTLTSLSELNLLKMNASRNPDTVAGEGTTKLIDLVAAEIAKEPDVPFAIIPTTRISFFADEENFNERFYCHSIWEVTRNKMRLKALNDVMLVGWGGYGDYRDLAKLEVILKRSGHPNFIDGIKEHRENWYGPESYT